MPTKYNRRKRRTRKRGGYLDPENEKLLNDTFTEAPTYEELFKFQQEKMQNKKYSEILSYMLKRFKSLKVSTNTSRDISALDDGF
jgi:hypothetical protein